MDFTLLEKLCAIPGISGDESLIRDFILNFIEDESHEWTCKPEVICGDEVQDGIILVFGKPTTAVFAHLDTVGYTAGYGANLIKVGGPSAKSGATLVGQDEVSSIICKLHKNKEGALSYLFEREIQRGTCLSYQPNFRINESFIESPYLDNRLGVFVALNLAKTLKNGIIAFSCFEEVGGGNTAVLARIIYEKYQVRQALISDITWVTSGVQHENGVAISLRDSGIPRKKYLKKILSIAQDSIAKFQLEVESSGGSDGNVLSQTPYPFDWCFIGAAEDNVHSPDEKVAINDVYEMLIMYQELMNKM